MMKKGFTLVELSIVLVIIGLLIGGILVGQSLVDSVKINRVIQEVGQYTVAIEQFKSKYNGLPGDSSKVAPAAVTSGSNIANNGLLNQTENRINFWPQLKNTVLPNLVTVQTNDNTGTLNCPKSVWGDGSTICFYFTGPYPFSTDLSGPLKYGHFFDIAKKNTPVFSVADSKALEAKMDDGYPRRGDLREMGIYGECFGDNGMGTNIWITTNYTKKNVCRPAFFYNTTQSVSHGGSW